MTQVAKWKYEEVERLRKLILEYPVVGVADVHGIPARQLQRMRELLRDEVLIRMSKKSLMQHALKKASKEEKSLAGLAEHIKGQPVFVFSKMDPFKLNKILEKNRAKAPVKPNTIAPRDIWIHKGETPFPPGPLLGELQLAGIPATIQGGKIVIKEDKVVVREGERVNAKVAAALNRLGVEPLELGIKLLAAHEGGTVFPATTLAIHEDRVISDLQLGYMQAVSLSLEAGYLTKATASLALQKCFREARTIAVEAGIFEAQVMDQLLLKAHLQMLSLAARLRDEALDDELRAKVRAEARAGVETETRAGVETETRAGVETETRAGVETETRAGVETEAETEAESEEKSEEEAISGLGALFG